MTGEEIIKKSNRRETDEERLKRLEKEKAVEDKKAEVAKHSPYRRFLQVNEANYESEDLLMSKSMTAYRVLRFLAHNMDNYNALICSYQVMTERLGYSRVALSRAVSLLQKYKYIKVGKAGTTNVYFINKELYWKSYGTNFSQAEFGAKIIMTSTDQDKENEEIQKEILKSRTPMMIIKEGNENELHAGTNETGKDNESISISDEPSSRAV